MADQTNHTILICTACKGTLAAKSLRNALIDRIPAQFVLRAVDCMAGCDRPVTVGFQASGKAQYLFGEIETDADTDALIQFAHQFLESDTGWTSASDRPEQLYNKTLARLPGPTAGQQR